jgi:quercetin dioxygenase-like cupin family protein
MGSSFPKKKPSKNLQRQKTDLPQMGYSFIRKGTGLIQDFMNGNLRMETLTHGTSAKTLRVAVVTLEPGASSDDTEIYFGEKWFYVLDGEMEMLVNDAAYSLSEGDSIYLEPTAVHTWRNSHSGQTKALVFSSPCSTVDAAAL